MSRSLPIFRRVTAMLLALVMAAPLLANEPLVLGSYAYPTLDRTLALTPLARLVEATTGQPVEIRLYRDPDEIAAAVAAGQVDVAVLNLGAWLRVARAGEVMPLATLVPAQEVQDRYRAVLLARPQLGLADLAQLAEAAPQLRLAAVLPGSTSGGLVQLAALADARNTPLGWGSVTYAGSHEAALQVLVNGDADLAAIAESPWRAWLTANPDPANLPREVWRSAPLPSGPLVCRQSARVACTMLATALTSDSSASRAAAEGLATGWPELAGADRFFAYDPARYAGLIGADMPGFGAREPSDSTSQH